MSSKNKSEIYQCIKSKIQTNEALSEKIYSLIAYGSFERDDFIEGLSDLDFFAVVHEDEMVIDKLKRILKKCSRDIDNRMIDLTWEYYENLDDPMNKCVRPWKFLTFYQNDFLENHAVIYGKGIENEIPRYDTKDLIGWRAEKLLQGSKEHKDDVKMLRIISGEVCRLIAKRNGTDSLKKSHIIKNLTGFDKKARKIYEAYLNEEQDRFEKKYLLDFIEKRCKKMIQIHGKFDVNKNDVNSE